jgi:protease-4
VALIYVTGTIMDVSGAQGNAGADDIAATITKAYSDKDISAIVVRVDSPGGSPTASETIRRALVKAQEKDKKVIVSMGPVAASGGYWISTHADKIFATPATLTGSIGVVMGKFEASDLWNKIGLNWEGPQIGKNAGIWSINQPFTEDELARMNVLIDNTYEAFLTRVAEGRGLSESQVRRIARGRVWTGEQARNVGLVDELGGLDQTLDFTAKMLGKGDRHDINVVKMPRELSGIERFLELIGQEVSIGAALKNATGIDPVFLKSLKGVANQAALSQQSPAMVYDAQLETSR